MTRAVVLAVLAMLCSGAASADQSAWPGSVEPAIEIAADPWADVGPSALFDVDDAYVFADVPRVAGLDADAAAAAVRIDRDRMAQAPAAPAGLGRVGGAFEGFVAVGQGELAYASVGMTRGDGMAAVRFARSPDLRTPYVAALLARR